VNQARRQELAAGGPKNRWRGQKPERGLTFLNYGIGCMEQPGAKREMGGHRFQMGGTGTTGPPLATTLM